jgi:hypothetical protein
MAGSLIAYQGHRCQSVVFNRSRGWGPDTSEVVLPVASFPDGFVFDLPPQGRLTDLPDLQLPDLSAIRTGRQAVLHLRRDLKWAGTLVLAEAQDEVWQVVAHPLFVMSVELVKASQPTPGARPLPALVRLVLADARAFLAGRGFLRRWSYNRTTASGELAKDSLGANGEVVTRDVIARDVVRALPGSPELSALPAAWLNDRRQVDFPPFAQAVIALGELVREGSLVDPCLRLDGSVALHKRGDGRVGWATDGIGRNSRNLPADLRLWNDGTGPGHSIEATYRDEFVVVRGGLRVQTVQTDNAEPVVYANGIVRVITEALVRELTGDKWSLDTLRRFVLRGKSKQQVAGIKPAVVKLFREQAFRMWRVPGVEIEKPTSKRDAAAIDLGIVLHRVDTVAEPGPNAHLLTGGGLLPRAETTLGKRWPVTVETYTYRGERRSLSSDSQEEANARSRMRELEQRITAVVAAAGSALFEFGSNPFAPELRRHIFDEVRLFITSIGSAPAEIPSEVLSGVGSVSWSDLGAKEDQAQLIERIAAVDSGLASQYEQQLLRVFTVRDAANGTIEVDLYKLAKRARADQKRLGEEVGEGFLGTVERALEGSPATRALADTLVRDIYKELGRLGKKQDGTQAGTRENAARSKLEKSRVRIHYVNQPRREVSASVFSAALGIIKTARIAGHLEDDGALDPSVSLLKIMPVRITFGSHVRPRLDVAPSASTGERGAVRQQESDDQLSWFTRAYRRGEGGAALGIGLPAIPPGEGRVVVRHDLVELIPLATEQQPPTPEQQARIDSGAATLQSLGLVPNGGLPNTAALAKTAKAIAEERFDAPAKIESATYVMARPWPVNPDGVVSRVTIRSRSQPAQGTGFRTYVTVGDAAPPAPGLGTTRERARPPVPRGERDAARREGLE